MFSMGKWQWAVIVFQIDGAYNLKYFLNMAGPDVLCVGSSGAAQVVLKRIEREASHRYQTLTLPEEGPSGLFMFDFKIYYKWLGFLFHNFLYRLPLHQWNFAS